MSLKNFVANQFRKPTGFWGKFAVRAMMKGNLGAIKWSIENSEIKENDVVLEIGFGHGISFAIIADKTKEKIYGLDFSEDMIELARVNNSQLVKENRLELRHGSAYNTQFDDNFFNNVIAVNVIYFWEEPQKELKEIFRILKRGGRVVMYLTDKTTMQKLPFTGTGVFHTYTGDEFASIVKSTGFVKVKYETKMLRGGKYLCHCLIAEKGE
jgi:ubiquinone/menaquinone biosynthesis C-methylase UbiE